MPGPGVISGSELILNETMNLTLYRDGKSSPVQGGRFGQVEATQGTGGVEHPIVFDRLDGGIGASERLIANSYPLAINGTTRYGRMWMPAGEQVRLPVLPNGAGGRPPGEILSMETIGDDLLVAAGGVLLRLSYPYDTWVVEHTVSPTEWIQDVMVYNGFIILGTKLANGSPGSLHIKDGVTWLVSGIDSDPTKTARRQHLCQAYFTIAGAGAWRLVSNDTPYTFRFIAATTAAQLLDDTAWAGVGGAYPVGDGYHPITNIVGAPLILYFTTTSGLFHVQDDGRSAMITDWSSAIHPENGKAAFFMFGGVYASHGRDGLVRVDVANQQTQWEEQACAPGFGFPRVTPLNGSVTAATSDGEWLVVPVFNGTDTHVCYGRPNALAQKLAMMGLQAPQSMNWHGSEASLYGQQVTATQQASIGPAYRPLLWLGGLEGSTPVVTNVSLSDKSTPLEDYLQGGPHRFNPESWLYLPRQDFGDEQRRAWATSRKVFTRLEVTGQYLERYVSWVDAFMATNQDHRVYWDRALEGEPTLWYQVGRLDSTEQISLVPGASVQSGVRAALMFRGYSEDNHPFVWTGAKLRGVPLLELAERRRYRVVVGRVRQANRAMSLRDREAQLEELFSFQTSDPIKLYDHAGVTLIVQIEEGMSYEEVFDRKAKDWVTVVTFNCRVIRRPFIWGAGYRFGSDIFWS